MAERRARPAPRFASTRPSRASRAERPRPGRPADRTVEDSRDGGDLQRRSAPHAADARRSRRARSGRSCSAFATTGCPARRQGEPDARHAAALHRRRQPRGSARPHSHRPEPRLPREGLRRVEVRRDLGGALSRHHHPVAARSRPVPADKHVMSVHVQFAPYKLAGGDGLDAHRDSLATVSSGRWSAMRQGSRTRSNIARC